MKKLIISLLVALGLTGAVFGAAATLDVQGTDQIGSGNEDVDAPSSVSDIAWTLDTGGDISLVDEAVITHTDPGAASTLYFQIVEDDGNGSISCGSVTLGSAVYTGAGEAVASGNTSTTIDSTSTPAFSDFPIADIDCVSITMTTP